MCVLIFARAFDPWSIPPGGFGGGGAAGMDPFLTGVAGNMLRQQGQSYLQRGQAFMQSKMGFLSGSSLHYHFSINPEYGESTARPFGGGKCPHDTELSGVPTA